MSNQTVQSIKLFLARKLPTLTALEVSWFGGEPLLAPDVIFEIQNCILSEQQTVAVSGNITTNGYHLTLPIATQLISSKVEKFQITLDGLPEDHNKTRVGKGGFPTFERIWANLLSLRSIAENFLVILRLHFHQENLESIRSLASLIEEHFLSDGRFKIHFKAINRLGSKNDAALPVITFKSQADIRAHLVESVSDSMLYTGNSENYICYASRFNSLAIRSDGTLAKCTVALKDDRNNVGRLLKDGQLEIQSDHISHWTRGVFSGDARTLACPMHAP